MKIINKNLKKNEIRIKTENMDDLWHLSHIIEPGDRLSGKTIRKIKIGEKEQRRTEVVKKKVFMEIETEKTELKDDVLRVSGPVLEGPEDVPKGSYHTFNVEEGSDISIKKEKWLKFQVDRLEEAAAYKQPAILICALDREEAIFALSKRFGYELLGEIKGDVQKKEERVVAKGSFYEDIARMIKEYADRYKTEDLIVASPAFFKEELLKHVVPELKKKITLATCSSVSSNAINEILKRPETKEVLKKDRITKEEKIVEKLFSEISKQDLGTYGTEEVKKAAEAGAVATLLVTDGFIHKKREEGNYEKLDSVMKTVDDTKGEIHIISSEFEAGKKLDGLGGIGAILRYKMNY